MRNGSVGQIRKSANRYTADAGLAYCDFSDYARNPRVQGSNIDKGAYEQ
jgi:hypothetical protein